MKTNSPCPACGHKPASGLLASREKKSVQIHLRLTETQKSIIDQNAKLAGAQSVSEFLLRKGLETPSGRGRKKA